MTHRQNGPGRVSPVNRDGHAIGLDIGGTAVRAAVLTPRVVDGRPSVSLHGLGRVGLPRGAVVNGVIREPGLVTHALKALWQQNRIDCRNVIVGVTSQQVVVRKVDLPNLPAAERAQALPFQARDIIALPIERAILDFIAVGPVDEGTNTVPGLLVAAPREPVSVTVRAVEQAGLRVARVDLAAFAALRAIAADDLPVEAVVDLGAHLTNIVIHSQGVPLMVRTVARGGDELTTALANRLGIDAEAAELAKRTVGLGEDDSETSRAIRDTIRPLLSELRSSLSAFEQANPDSMIERVSLTGGGAAMPGLAEEVTRIGDIPVDVVDAMTHVGSHRAQHADDAARTISAVAVGLAMGAAA
ncbi:MAG TPA: type IV pilus assembly protein PilM [Jatrophihabitantaceae bacterium]|nr:type IV pilus assembly protein PilM [Jatrophihabitantaceae bacterium]